MPSNEMWLRMAAIKGVNGARITAYLTKAADSAPLDTQTLLKAVLNPAAAPALPTLPVGRIGGRAPLAGATGPPCCLPSLIRAIHAG